MGKGVRTTMAHARRIIDHGLTVHLTVYSLGYSEQGTRTFWVPEDGGYVRETTDARRGTVGVHICQYLLSTGLVLFATPNNLAEVIRREHNAYERARENQV